MSADSSVRLSSTSSTLNDDEEVFAAFSPGFDYFAVRGFSVGLDLTLSYDFTRSNRAGGALVDTTRTTVGAGPRFGFDFVLSDAFSFYPRVTVGIESLHTQERDAAAVLPGSAPVAVSSSSLSGGYVTVFAPLLFHPSPHFFLGAGPGVYTELGTTGTGVAFAGERTTTFVRLTMGAWWGGDASRPRAVAEPAEEPSWAAPARPRDRRFGDAGTTVLSGELAAGISNTTYANLALSVTSYELRPAVDHFVADHVSLGGALRLSRSKVDATNDLGEKGELASTGVGATARLGVDLPLASSLSLYTRASLDVGRSWFSVKSSVRNVDTTSNTVTVGLYAPLLAHVAPHAFVGFGPYVARDLVNRPEDSQSNDLRTTVGAQLAIGGWLSR